MRDSLKNAKRIVVKVGTSTITHPQGGMNLVRMEKLVREIADLHSQGKEIILVTSGAIAVGRQLLSIDHRPDTLPRHQRKRRRIRR